MRALPLVLLLACRVDNDLVKPGGDPDACTPIAWYADADGDGYGADEVDACEQPDGAVEIAGDCDDALATVNPGADETCNALDDDCDGTIDEDLGTSWYPDIDGDGHGDPAGEVVACDAPAGYVQTGDDCDDADALVLPGAPEICDGVDDDCDGRVDDADDDRDGGSTWYADVDGDGHGDAASSVVACEAPEGYTSSTDDCDDTDPEQYPGATVTLVTVRACVDGSDWFVLQDTRGWWVHRNYEKVGLHPGCADAATYLDGVAWTPTWAGDQTDPYDPMPKTLPAYDTTVSVSVTTGRGAVTVTDQPTSANGWKAAVLLDDDAQGGPADYEVTIAYAACP